MRAVGARPCISLTSVITNVRTISIVYKLSLASRIKNEYIYSLVQNEGKKKERERICSHLITIGHFSLKTEGKRMKDHHNIVHQVSLLCTVFEL